MSAAIGLNSVGDSGSGSRLFERALRGCERRVKARPARRDSSRCAVLAASGDLTRDEVLQGLYARCRRAVELGVDELLVDLSGATRADSKVVAMLSAVAQRARRAGIPVEVRCGRVVRDWMRICRVERFFNLSEG